MGDDAGTSNGGIIFAGTQTLAGNAMLVFGRGGSNELFLNSGTLTLGPQVFVHGQNGSIHGSILNQGTIAADVGGGTIAINGNSTTPSWSSPGVLRGSNGGSLDLGGTWTAVSPLTFSGGGRLFLEGNWSNTSQISVTGSTLELGGNFTTAGIGTLNRTGGTVRIVGLLDNTGATLAHRADRRATHDR